MFVDLNKLGCSKGIYRKGRRLLSRLELSRTLKKNTKSWDFVERGQKKLYTVMGAFEYTSRNWCRINTS